MSLILINIQTYDIATSTYKQKSGSQKHTELKHKELKTQKVISQSSDIANNKYAFHGGREAVTRLYSAQRNDACALLMRQGREGGRLILTCYKWSDPVSS